MRHVTIPFLTVFSMLLLASCTQTTAPHIDNPHGAFQGSLLMYDSTGSNPIQGRLSLSRGDSTDLSGTWSLQNGQGGKLAGAMTDSTINVNLNPNLVDANTYLIGAFDGTTIKGRWFFVGVMGPINHGTFTATSD